MSARTAATVKVWDLFVRVFHWSLVALMATAWLTPRFKQLHHWTGYAILALVGARVIWGMIGSRHARFADFVRGPAAIAGYLGDLVRGRERRYLGHNPAGGAMIVALLLTILVTAASGWLMLTDWFWGSQTMENIHETSVNLIWLLVAGHLAGVVYESRRHRENLVRAMITGCKRA